MKIALCFRFAQTFDFALLRQGNLGKFRGKFKGLKSIEQGHTEVLFTIVQNSHSVPCKEASPP